MMRKMLLAAALSVTAMTAHADYQCSVTPANRAGEGRKRQSGDHARRQRDV